MAFAPAEGARLARAGAEVVAGYHRDNPLRPGIPKASLASRLEVDAAVLEALVAGSPDLRDDGATVAAGGFGGALTAEQQTAWEEVRSTLESSGLAVPRLKELGIDLELVHALVRDGKLVRISEDLVYLPGQIEDLTTRLRSISGPFTVAQFRDALGISRKYAVPLLEYLDAERVTVRTGDLRSVRT